MNGAQAARLLAGRHRVRGGHRRLPPGQAGHDRQVAGHRQPGRRPVRGRAGAQDRRRRRQRHRRRDPRRHPAARRDDRHLHRDRRRRDHRDAGQARRARRHRPRRARRRRSSPARASRRSTPCAARSRRTRSTPSFDAFEARVRGGDGLMAVTVKIPPQLRVGHRRRPGAERRGRDGRRGARRAVRAARRAARPRRRRRRRRCGASSTSSSTARTSASSTGWTRRCPTGAELQILPAVAGRLTSRQSSAGAGPRLPPTTTRLFRFLDRARCSPDGDIVVVGGGRHRADAVVAGVGDEQPDVVLLDQLGDAATVDRAACARRRPVRGDRALGLPARGRRQGPRRPGRRLRRQERRADRARGRRASVAGQCAGAT